VTRAFVALHPETRQRLGVAWSELDAYEMLKGADAKVDGIAELTQVEVSRTPEQMRQQRAHRAQLEAWQREQGRLRSATAPAPEGYRVRTPHRLAPATMRRWNSMWEFELREIVAADGWCALQGGNPYGTATNALAARGMILIAEPITGSKPLLYCATGRGRDRMLGSRHKTPRGRSRPVGA
jgi:hypothetical protein